MRTRKKLEKMQAIATTADEPQTGQPIVLMVDEDIMKEQDGVYVDGDSQEHAGGLVPCAAWHF